MSMLKFCQRYKFQNSSIENMYWAFWHKLPLSTTFLPCNDHFFTTFLLPFTTFMVCQRCLCKLAILRGFALAFPLSSTGRQGIPGLLWAPNIFPLEKYYSYTFLFLSLEYCKASFSVMDFTLGLISASLGRFLQTFICNLVFRASFRVFEYSIAFPQE